MRKIITLLTDFGTRDHYVASMKGVILRINPQCTLIDITHQVRPHDIREGAFTLANAYSYFPKGTIHLSVVDPGVGGPRNPILLVTREYLFLGPDNGLLTLAAQRDKVKQAVILTNRKFFLPRISATFHGRDLFAPAAGYLSLGVRPGVLGQELGSWVELDFGKPRMERGGLAGKIVHIDAFGNLVTNINGQQIVHFAEGRSFVIRVGKMKIRNFTKGYWEGKKGDLMALIGSGGLLEISVREGSAQKILGVKKGHKVEVRIQ